MSRRQKILRDVVTLIVMLFVSVAISTFPTSYDVISYAKFKDYISKGTISSISYYEENQYAIVHETTTEADYKVYIISPQNFENDIYAYSLLQEEFLYQTAVEKAQLGLIPRYMILIFTFASVRFLWRAVYLMIITKKIQKGDNSEEKRAEKEELSKGLFKGFASSKFSGRKVDEPGVTFKDVIGLDNQIEELQDVVDFLKDPSKYEEMGASLPRGVLLHGKPGVGKTHIARAIAGEANVPFFEVSASELQSKYLGESEERIRNLFDEARKVEPSIIYIDEIDSIATQRFSENSNKYSASIVNQLLSCMDGFSKDSQVIVIASTNYVATLDSALLRSGRFDRKIFIHGPDKVARRKLFEYYSQDKLIDDMMDIDRFLDITTGLTGTDIKTILNEAAILTVRNGNEFITEETLMEAFRKVEIGPENSFKAQSKESLRRTAVHEAGHTIVSYHFGQTVSEISIVSRGNAAGYNLYADDDTTNYGFKELKHRIMCLLAGRAAEEFVYSEASEGASDDLMRASTIIKDMFLKFAMRDEPEISLVFINDSKFNEVIANRTFTKMNDFMKKCYAETMGIIRSQEAHLKRLTDALLKKETLSKSEIEDILTK